MFFLVLVFVFVCILYWVDDVLGYFWMEIVLEKFVINKKKLGY